MMVNAIYDVIGQRKTASIDAQLLALGERRTKLAHFAARQQAIIKAAIADTGFGKMRPGLGGASLHVVEARAMNAPGRGPLGFVLTASKPRVP